MYNGKKDMYHLRLKYRMSAKGRIFLARGTRNDSLYKQVRLISKVQSTIKEADRQKWIST
jgi:hypothetical protein